MNRKAPSCEDEPRPDCVTPDPKQATTPHYWQSDEEGIPADCLEILLANTAKHEEYEKTVMLADRYGK